ncbi:hypothetical protein HPB52_016593 [Rhipicephalus sanguineus]|uniref:Endonuclease/exonuclease/phosphatase domain-containing protein n=1 Tax=Rhipicephalus sanguineus TaxID=34632 RepID=A0A9D4Q7H9_RHISA|nr:hypothetical protein HPB52_016593 [Rhipicephalus sanguineus]
MTVTGNSRLVIGGDFNAPHTQWGYGHSSKKGKDLADLIEKAFSTSRPRTPESLQEGRPHRHSIIIVSKNGDFQRYAASIGALPLGLLASFGAQYAIKVGYLAPHPKVMGSQSGDYASLSGQDRSGDLGSQSLDLRSYNAPQGLDDSQRPSMDSEYASGFECR